MLLYERSAPVGARLATKELVDQGVSTSEASVSRVFVRLDAAGLTEAIGRKGRVLTALGHEVASTAMANRKRNAGFNQALRIRSVEQLMDLLYARRGVEREIARAAAVRRSAKQLRELETIMRDHERALATGEDPSPSGMEFHRAIVRMAGGELFGALGDVVLNESLLPLEQVLDAITGGRGTMGKSAPEHQPIMDAIKSKDADGAGQAMADHLTRLITEVEAFARSGNSRLFERLLRLAH
jgi:GntR family L-lactate dehydrogenase operon transcriptional regulator